MNRRNLWLLSLAFVGLLFFLNGCNRPKQQERGSRPLYEIVVLNHTPIDICQIQFTKHNQRTWGDNLPQGLLPSGKCAVVEVPAGMFDLRFIPCDREEFPLERHGVIVDKDMSLPLIIGYPPGIGVSVDCPLIGERGAGSEEGQDAPPYRSGN